MYKAKAGQPPGGQDSISHTYTLVAPYISPGASERAWLAVASVMGNLAEVRAGMGTGFWVIGFRGRTPQWGCPNETERAKLLIVMDEKSTSDIRQARRIGPGALYRALVAPLGAF